MYEAAHRLCKVDIKKKKPIEIEHIHILYEELVQKSTSLTDLRTMIICLLGYSGFMRFSELVEIRRCDVIFCHGYMKIFIEKSKTDIYRDGKWLYINACDSPCCPIKNLQRYFEKANIMDENSEEFIIRAITVFKRKKAEKLRPKNKPLSYTSAREYFLEAVKRLGLDISGLHSLRSGGATAAANSGVPDRLFKRHGRWKTENIKDGYVKDDIKSLLLVSKSLGL